MGDGETDDVDICLVSEGFYIPKKEVMLIWFPNLEITE